MDKHKPIIIGLAVTFFVLGVAFIWASKVSSSDDLIQPSGDTTRKELPLLSKSTLAAPPKPIGPKRQQKAEDVFDQAEKIDAFRQELKENFEELPTIKEIQSALQGHEKHHGPPKTLLASGSILGKIKRRIKENRALVPEALRFYRQCAITEGLPNSLRAVCLRNLVDWSKHIEAPLDLSQFPDRILKLADYLPAEE